MSDDRDELELVEENTGEVIDVVPAPIAAPTCLRRASASLELALDRLVAGAYAEYRLPGRTVDCVVIGLAGAAANPALVLGLRHADGNLHHFAVTRPMEADAGGPIADLPGR